MAITFPASPSDGAVFTNSTTGVKYIYNATDGVWKTHVWPTNTDYLQLSGGTLTGDLSLGTNDLTAQDINSTTLTTTGGVTVGNGLTVSDGNVVMASGHGIDFSADSNASGMTSELLDDYEEGTFTPAYNAGLGGVNGYSVQQGTYTKIGRLVTFAIHIRANAGSNSGSEQVKIGGLPFNNGGSANEGGAFFNYRDNLDTGGAPFLHIGQNTNIIHWFNSSGGNWVGSDGAGILNKDFHINGFYFV